VSLIHSRLDFGHFILVALYQRQLHSVLNAAARLEFRLRRYDHITDAIAVLHWLRVPQRVDYKVAVMVFRALNGLHLDQLVRVADLPGRHRLHSFSSHRLHVPAYRLPTVGRRLFPVAASIVCNSLSHGIQSSSSLSNFCHRLNQPPFQTLTTFPSNL